MNPFFLYPWSRTTPYISNQDIEKINLIANRLGILYTQIHPLPDPLYGMQWKRPKEICSKPYFIDGKPSRFDALQGSLGNCWLIAAMEGLAMNEEFFNLVVPPGQSFDENYTGAFHFRFWVLGTWYDVVVDDRLPVFPPDSNNLLYANSRHQNVFWAPLLEKAYSKLCNGQYVDYYALTTGISSSAFQDFTGGIMELINLQEYPKGRTFKWFVNELISNKAFATVDFAFDDDGTIFENQKLRSNHSYLVSGVFYTKDDDPDYHGLCLVRLMNPWGSVEWKGRWSDKDFQMWKQIDRRIREKLHFKVEDDGEFYMSEEDLKKWFEFMCICHLKPGKYFRSHHGKDVEAWSPYMFKGEWVKGVSAGGLEKLHLNPQYKIYLETPRNDADGLVSVVIELTERDPSVKKDSTAMLVKCHPPKKLGCLIYHLKNNEENLDQLDADFLKTNSPLNFVGANKHATQLRSYVLSIDLPQGWYCFIPFLFDKDHEANFLLRIFTEFNLHPKEFDSRISKSLTIKEHPDDYVIYEEQKRIFDEVAQNGNLDWIGLKDSLDKGMSATSYFRFKWFWSAKPITNGPLIKPDAENENGNIVFSKDECRMMIAMMDEDHSGKLNYHEFCNLLKNIHFWCRAYNSFRDSEGYLKVEKLRDALSSIGFNLNKRVLPQLLHFYVDEGHIKLKSFILCGVTLETFFKRYETDKLKEGFKLTLEEWVKLTMVL